MMHSFLQSSPHIGRLAIAGLVLAIATGCSDSGGTSGAAKPPASAPIHVGVITLTPQTTPKLMQLPGRAVAFATAEIRPQVNGIVQRIAFREGGAIKAGDTLYELDNKSYVAARDASAAAVAKAEASVAGAQATFDRTQQLVDSKTVSAQTLDDARSTLLQAKADQQAAQADLQAAEINLGYTVIKAPISGVISTSAVSVGSLATANQTTAMATIRQIEPIYVDLVDSSANLLEIRQQIEDGRLQVEKSGGTPTPPKVTLTLETGKPYDETGAISAADTTVSQSTGTFSIRASFENARRILLPGMYVRASVDLGTIGNVFLVPQRAVSRDAAGAAQIYVVDADNKVEVRTVHTDGSTANAWIVTDGVKEGEKVVVDGGQRVTEGAMVAPVEVTINDQGVVEQDLALPPASSDAAGAAAK